MVEVICVYNQGSVAIIQVDTLVPLKVTMTARQKPRKVYEIAHTVGANQFPILVKGKRVVRSARRPRGWSRQMDSIRRNEHLPRVFGHLPYGRGRAVV